MRLKITAGEGSDKARTKVEALPVFEQVGPVLLMDCGNHLRVSLELTREERRKLIVKLQEVQVWVQDNPGCGNPDCDICGGRYG